MSSYIEKSRGKYYAYTLVENNARLAGVTDVSVSNIFYKNVMTK